MKYLRQITITLFCVFAFSQIFSQNLINHKGKDLFLQGINLAWMDFGNDLTTFSSSKFETIMSNISAAGGNSARWWIHIDGRSALTYDVATNMITGIAPQAIVNLKTALDIAAEHGVVLSLCLWSFDMMRSTNTSIIKTRNRLMLENVDATNAYINNALIPMVNAVKGHTSILCWEIFNEPEGMTTLAGWSNIDKIDMTYIQRFVNLTSGAIHRADSDAKVSNGCWNAIATCEISEINNSKNYYSDAELIAKGGDADGVLDFYMLHYYADYNGDKYSPFMNPVTYWQLDKPMLIGEFAAHGIIEKTGVSFAPTKELSTAEAMVYLKDNNYAGGWGWTYTNHDGFGGLDDMKQALDSIKVLYPDLVSIPRDPNHNYIPKLIGTIKDTIVLEQTASFIYANMHTVFSDDSNDELTFTAVSTGPVEVSFDEFGNMQLSLLPDSIGLCKIVVTATDKGGKKISTQFAVSVKPLSSVSLNKLLYANCVATSYENLERHEFYINDGDYNTRWSSVYTDIQTLEFDMGALEKISRIHLLWEAAYGDSYTISVSTDKQDWTPVFEIFKGQKAGVNVIFDEVECRYIRFDFTKRATAWGYSIYEVEAYAANNSENNVAPTVALTNQSIKAIAGTEKKFTFPRTQFIDANNDVLELSASMSDNSALPSFITFNPQTLEFVVNATEDQVGEYSVAISATDWFNQTETYTMPVTVATAISSTSHVESANLAVYPNPCSKQNAYVLLNHQNVVLQMYNAIGMQVINEVKQSGNGKFELPTKNLPKGLYSIRITSKENTYTTSILVK